MPTRERKSDSEASKLKNTVHERAVSYSHVSEAPLTSSATGRKEKYGCQEAFKLPDKFSHALRAPTMTGGDIMQAWTKVSVTCPSLLLVHQRNLSTAAGWIIV